MADVSSGTGKGGKSFQDRQLAATVRTKALESIKLILEDDPSTKDWSDYKKQLLLKMSSSILPRLNEHTGADGAEFVIQITGETATRYGVAFDPKTSSTR